MALIEVKNLKHIYQDGSKKKTVLKDVDVTFQSGNFYCILGESGSGKTTFLSLIAGLEKVQKGQITFNEKDINEIGLSEYRLNYVNIIFQAYNLIPYMTALENVVLALDIAKVKTDNKKETAYKLLESVGIDRETAERTVLKLSGGEQQRTAIARALGQEDAFIMADEPTGNLDEDTEAIIIDIFKKLKETGRGVIVVTHSKKVAENADIVYKMKNGKLIP